MQVAEWFKALVSKTNVGLNPTAGSNPALYAYSINQKN